MLASTKPCFQNRAWPYAVCVRSASRLATSVTVLMGLNIVW
jgi:hypothetical protein